MLSLPSTPDGAKHTFIRGLRHEGGVEMNDDRVFIEHAERSGPLNVQGNSNLKESSRVGLRGGMKNE